MIHFDEHIFQVGWNHHLDMDVSKNSGFYSPQIIHLLHLFIGFGTIIFTIHFGIPLFWKHPYADFGRRYPPWN